MCAALNQGTCPALSCGPQAESPHLSAPPPTPVSVAPWAVLGRDPPLPGRACGAAHAELSVGGPGPLRTRSAADSPRSNRTAGLVHLSGMLQEEPPAMTEAQPGSIWRASQVGRPARLSIPRAW